MNDSGAEWGFLRRAPNSNLKEKKVFSSKSQDERLARVKHWLSF